MNLQDKILELRKVQEMKKVQEIRVLKTESHNTVTFVALEPDTVDYNGDIASKDEIIKAAHTFMIDLQNKKVNVNHEENTDIDPEDARFVESYILPVDLEFDSGTVKEGSWLVAIKFSDAIFQKILSGDIVGISIEGWYKKEIIS